MSASERLKLAKISREGGTENFTFFEPDVQVEANFGVVNDLIMFLEALSKAIVFYDMGYLHKILLNNLITLLESKLKEYLN